MAEAIPFTVAASPDMVDLSIQDMWIQTKPEGYDYYKKYTNVETGVTDYYTKDSRLSGMGEASRILDGAIITAESPIQGYDKTWTQVHFGKMLRITKMMWIFGIKKRDMQRAVSEVKRTCLLHREKMCADRLDQSFQASYTKTDDSGNYTIATTGGNAVRLTYDSQSREDGGTANVNEVHDGSTQNQDMNYDAIKAAHYTVTNLSPLKDAKGKPMNVNLDRLIVSKGHNNAYIAKEILGAIRSGKKPQSAERDGSGVDEFEIVQLPYITTNTGFWWMLDSSMQGGSGNLEYGLQYKEAQPIMLDEQHQVYSTKEFQYTATYLASFGHNDYRGIVGSQNDNS